MSEVIKGDSSSSDESLEMDRDFTPTADMLVHEFDDEATLDEEEEIEPLDSQLLELADLQRERDMPLEELLNMYGYNFDECAPEILNVEGDVSQSSTNLNEASVPEANHNSEDGDEDEPPKKRSKIRYLRDNHPSDSNSEEDMDEDDDYLFNIEDEEKCVRIGVEFQAIVPEGLCKYDDALPYENEDKLLWDPKKLPEEEVEKYLSKVRELKFLNKKNDCKKNDAKKFSVVIRERKRNRPYDSVAVKDDEQALYLLLQCGFNVEEALRRQRLNVIPQTNMSLWSEDECTHFESGLYSFGKDFHQIQLHKVRTRSVEELVQFYYYWKKSERHDVFVSNFRMEKKKYNMHPEITDFMEKCNDEPEIEEQPDSNGETVDANSSCNNGDFLFNTGPGGSRPIRHLMDDDLRSEDSVTLLRGKNAVTS
ncbi:mesoderm induction early response protein 1-like [Planococcus citri]|uniref:mesoderm induction early response protein 1-like n=1 Tax=Planococcus citri TaxID=170843 RepID=UPI0031F74EE1